MLTIVLFFGLWLGLWLPIAIGLGRKLKWVPFRAASLDQKLPLLLSLYALAPVALWLGARLSSQSLEDYGLTGADLLTGAVVRSHLIGLGIALAGLALLWGVQWRCGWLVPGASDSPPPPILPVLALTGLLALVIGLIEEWVFRGFGLSQLVAPWGLGLAALGLSLVFALLHLVWDGWGAAPQLPGLTVLGLVLCLAWWADGGSIGLAWGLHTGWVWGLAGLDATERLRPDESAPGWGLGWAGLPLTSPLILILLSVTGAIVWQIGLKL
jgi:membrane protease YdiL (CAAX protease family)